MVCSSHWVQSITDHIGTPILLTGGENHLFLKLCLTHCFVVNIVLSFGGENTGMKL